MHIRSSPVSLCVSSLVLSARLLDKLRTCQAAFIFGGAVHVKFLPHTDGHEGNRLDYDLTHKCAILAVELLGHFRRSRHLGRKSLLRVSQAFGSGAVGFVEEVLC